ncbi:MAG: rhodanese-like domain-containing protein [Pseudomonadota bacterium]
MRLALFVSIAIIASPFAASAQEAPRSSPQIDYPGFLDLTSEVAKLRSERLLGRDDFFTRAQADGALLLDTRSAAAFEMGHIEGAVNLPFSDFTEEKLRAVIGDDTDRPIFIYCNNNFSDDVVPIRLKSAPLALNIPTFINLVGYGYSNVWELGDTIPIAEANWVSTLQIEP